MILSIQEPPWVFVKLYKKHEPKVIMKGINYKAANTHNWKYAYTKED